MKPFRSLLSNRSVSMLPSSYDESSVRVSRKDTETGIPDVPSVAAIWSWMGS